MADSIMIKGGTGTVPVLKDRELAYSKDEKALYIGTMSGNVRLCGEGNIAELSAKIDEIKAKIDAVSELLETPTE